MDNTNKDDNLLLREFVEKCAEPLTESCRAWGRLLKPHAIPMEQYAQGRKRRKIKPTSRKVTAIPTGSVREWASRMARESGIKGYDVRVSNIKRFYSRAA